MTEIKRIGAYLETDSEGFLCKNASASRIQGEWTEMVEAATDACIERWGDYLHSVYVRGSVVNGTAISGLSDVDMIVVMYRDRLDPETVSEWSRHATSALEARFPQTGGFELACFTEETVLTRGSPESVIVGLECACVYGNDLSEEILPYRPGPDIALQTAHFRANLDVFRDEYPDETPEDKKATMAWLMRRFLRVGMELVMAEEERFTRDLYLCYESFSKHYPSKEQAMYRALELAIDPVPNIANEGLVREFGEWLAGECERKLREWISDP